MIGDVVDLEDATGAYVGIVCQLQEDLWGWSVSHPANSARHRTGQSATTLEDALAQAILAGVDVGVVGLRRRG